MYFIYNIIHSYITSHISSIPTILQYNHIIYYIINIINKHIRYVMPVYGLPIYTAISNNYNL